MNLFQKFGGALHAALPAVSFPAIHATVQHTDRGIPYFDTPGVAMIGRTVSEPENLRKFLEGFDEELDFPDYLEDESRPEPLSHGEALVKLAGQLCYMSFGENRTRDADAERYFMNLREQGHGSVFEHVNYTFLFYGTSRSLSHELVRHRLAGYSQVSQRYVGGKTLRFVERPEFASDGELHGLFLSRIERSAAEYADLTERMLAKMPVVEGMSRAEKTARVKAVRQASRACLPNETEAPIVTTMNGRAWRHFIEQRCSRHAEPEIRNEGARVLACLQQTDALLYNDYTVVDLPDGTVEAVTTTRKV